LGGLNHITGSRFAYWRFAVGDSFLDLNCGRFQMKRVALLLAVVCTSMTALFVTAGPAAGHCVPTPAGTVDLSPGHFAAAGGHNQAIAHSGVVGTCDPNRDPAEDLNASAPDNNPG
jgi:hypothetical protein